jgi:1,4-alpha-glucan branching enzyme
MIKRSTGKDGVKLTFTLSLQDTPHPVSVLGDFNRWDPHAHPLKKRSNGTRSVSVVVEGGGAYAFKYLADGGTWFNDIEADDFPANEYGEVNSLVRT